MVAKKLNTDLKIVGQKVAPNFSIILKEDGILYCHVTTKQKWTKEDFQLLFETIGEMVNYKKAPILISYEKNIFPSVEGAAYWASLETKYPYISAEAVILDTISLKMLGDFFLRSNSLERPVKLFDNTKEALEWLKTFI